jgi:hypothetical protein
MLALVELQRGMSFQVPGTAGLADGLSRSGLVLIPLHDLCGLAALFILPIVSAEGGELAEISDVLLSSLLWPGWTLKKHDGENLCHKNS